MCTHYWICAEAKGPTSLCHCIKCNLEQFFSNVIEGEDYERFKEKPRGIDINDILPFPNQMIY